MLRFCKLVPSQMYTMSSSSVVVGYPFGGLCDYFLGKTTTFLAISALILCQICFQLTVLRSIEHQQVITINLLTYFNI